VNAFPTDTAAELEAVREVARANGVPVVTATHFTDGGEGALELARAVTDTLRREPPELRFLYPDDLALEAKIEALATRIYGAAQVEYTHAAASQLEELQRLGFGTLPICMAKTHFSLSHDPRLGPNPRGFRFPVRELRLAAGAGFVTAVAGEMMLMPGLPERPAAEEIDLADDGRVIGLR
jgi:formate--tetrahydrofolate ligase